MLWMERSVIRRQTKSSLESGCFVCLRTRRPVELKFHRATFRAWVPYRWPCRPQVLHLCLWTQAALTHCPFSK